MGVAYAAGVALERYVLIVPSILPHTLLVANSAALGGLAFLGAAVLTVSAFVRKYSPISAADEVLRPAGARYLTVILDLDVDVAAHSESPLNSQRQ